MLIAPTPKDALHRDGTLTLYRFRSERNVWGDLPPNPPGEHGASVAEGAMPLLLVPSLINRWYVLDLRAKASLAAAMVGAGLDTFCVDWGIPEAEDRYLSWDLVLDRLARAARVVRRTTGARKIGLLGYCMGGTLAGIHTALNPDGIAALVNLAGPFDFAHAGFLGEMVDARWFDAHAIAEAGNVGPAQMQSGFTALRPTGQIAKWMAFADKAHNPEAREAFEALEAWASDNIPFPGAAYETYITELYQQNLLVQGKHYVRGERVDLGAITCPVLTVVTDRDTICPPAAATALNSAAGSLDKEVLVIPGGHVGAVVGGKAPKVLYPALASWFCKKLNVRAPEAKRPVEAQGTLS